MTAGMGPPFLNFIIGKHMKMLSFKFLQNRTINEKFDFFEERRESGWEGGGTLIFKF